MADTRTPAWPLLVVGLGTLVVPLDSAVNVAFPAIVARFALPIPMIQWVVISYVLTQTSLMLTFGRIGDMVGYRRVFLCGTGFSTLAFAACALSPSYAVLLAGRIAQGIGAGLILSCGPALATSLFPEAMRTRILGHYMLMFGLGAALGPSAFGPLVQWFGWSSVWAFRAPISLLAFLLAWTLPRSSHPEQIADARNVRQREAARHASEQIANARQREAALQVNRRQFDAVGGALLALALAFLLLALNQARNPPAAIPCALLALAGFALFYRQERRFPRPIIDFAHFLEPGFTLANVENALVNLAAFAIMLLAPFYLDQVAHLPLPKAGLVLAASPIGIILGAPLAGRLATRHSPRLVGIAGMVASAAGLFAISLAPGIGLLSLAMLLQGLGLGVFQVAYFDIVTAAIPAEQRGVAGALGMATRTIGTVTGATVLMLIFQAARGEAGAETGITAAFQATFRCAALLTAALALLDARWVWLARRRGMKL